MVVLVVVLVVVLLLLLLGGVVVVTEMIGEMDPAAIIGLAIADGEAEARVELATTGLAML